MKKIVCITGTRPQMIKHSILLRSLIKFFEIETIHTLQHYQFELNELLKSDLFINETFHQLTIDTTLSSAKRMAAMLDGIAGLLDYQKPAAVLVYGDTDTTLAGALAANKIGIPLIHVEAGERSFNISMPEETNRIITDTLSQICFCASEQGLKNLLRENIERQVFFSGDVMKDLLQETSKKLEKPLLQEAYIYCTIHRNYNKSNRKKLQQLLLSLSSLDYLIVFPVHPSTLNTIEALRDEASPNKYANIQFLAPVSYTQSIHYQKFAKAIITDSGGIQKEAYWLQRPCFTFRNETEWLETLTGSWNRLVYEDIGNLKDMLNLKPGIYNHKLYGDGHASKFIMETLVHIFK